MRKLKVTFDHMNIDVREVIEAAEYGAWTGARRLMRSMPLSAEEFARYDLVLLSTAHGEFRYPALSRDTKLVVDTRNVIRA